MKLSKTDNLDVKILSHLLNNCRESDRQIGQKIGLSGVAVKSRIGKMIKSNLIENFTLKIEPHLLGYNVIYLVTTGQDVNEIVNQVKLVGEPFFVVPCIGGISACGIVVKGEVELIGQVRPGPQKAVKIYVDDDPEMACSNLVCFEWVREDFSSEVDNQGRSSNSFFEIQMRSLNRMLKSFADWLFVREPMHSEESARQRGGIPFILHDGSGGIRIEPSMFHLIRYQDPLKVWNVGKTRWTLYGLRLGDPVYIRGELIPRSKEELADENLIDAPKNAVMKVHGKNETPEQEYVLAQGSEYSILAYTYSVFETFYLPLFYLLAFLIMLITTSTTNTRCHANHQPVGCFQGAAVSAHILHAGFRVFGDDIACA